jgi:hypothetical protein
MERRQCRSIKAQKLETKKIVVHANKKLELPSTSITNVELL